MSSTVLEWHVPGQQRPGLGQRGPQEQGCPGRLQGGHLLRADKLLIQIAVELQLRSTVFLHGTSNHQSDNQYKQDCWSGVPFSFVVIGTRVETRMLEG